MMPPASVRPVTSKPRGICKYYATERGCFSGDSCKFLHGVPNPEGETKDNDQPLLTPYDQAKRCKYFDKGYCKRGENCWFLHKLDKPRMIQEEDDDEFCSICFEKPAIYGLLGGCSHTFCLTCIKQWRDPQNKPEGVAESGNTKKCPMCRVSSKFITPSSKFWKHGTEEKEQVMKAYMASMARVPCRYFQKSLLKDKNDPICPYGRDCFYSHMKEDGTPYVFKDGVDVCMKRYRRTPRRTISSDFFSALSYLGYAIGDSTDPLTANPQAVSTDDTPVIHREHSSDRGGDEDGLSRTHRRRIQEVMMRSLSNPRSTPGLLAMELLRVGWEMSGAALANRSEWDELEQDSTRRDEQGSEDERENEVMERLEMVADEMLASVTAFREIGPEVLAEPLSSEQASFVHGSTTEQSEDDDDSDMPPLQSVYSDDEEDEGDTDEDSEPATEESTLISSEPSEESTEALDDPGSSPRTSNLIGVRTSDEEADEIRNDKTVVMQPVTLTNGSGKTPSDAFTTDGRGRVISVGDATNAAASLQVENGVPAESTDGGEASMNYAAERRGGLLGWIGSLI